MLFIVKNGLFIMYLSEKQSRNMNMNRPNAKMLFIVHLLSEMVLN
jgi:hypothetical protein